MSHLSEFISWGNLILKLFIKNVLSLKTKKYCQLCIDYESNKYILNNFFEKV